MNLREELAFLNPYRAGADSAFRWSLFLLQLLPYCLLGFVSAAIAPAWRATIEQTPKPPAPAARRPQVAIGDTVYVAARFLNVRSSPRADGPGDPNI